MTRLLLAVIALVAAGACHRDAPPNEAPRVLVLGIDGMDPSLLAGLIESGRMPNFARVADAGSFLPLETSAPPQSPVAWSNFIAGADPGSHQIYDFIHRDPAPASEAIAVQPYLSTSRVEPPTRDWAIDLGDWRIPLFGSQVVSLRRGGAFWDHLAAAGIPTAIYRVPANYPPPTLASSGPFRCLCGMGTPDLLGTYGLFTLFTSEPLAVGRTVSGGRFVRLRLNDDRSTGILLGPANYLRRPGPDGTAPPLQAAFEIVRDPREDVVKISIGDEVALLNVNEWSEWIPIRMDTGIPGSAVLGAAGLPTGMDGMVRFYVKQVHPTLEVYATPINIDPLDAVNPIAAPADFAREIADVCGRYYTTGIPEDTKALRAGAIDEDEFLAQVELLENERFRQYRHALSRFDRGFLFFYFGHTDQLSHIFWRDRDPGHPAYDPVEAVKYARVIEEAYVEMDGLLGEALDVLDDDDVVIAMSDHGFTSFRRGFNLNTWLREAGYLVAPEPSGQSTARFFHGVDWSRSRAYALGLNALYLNLAGRERNGVVDETDAAALLEEITEGLLSVRDANGQRVIDRVYDTATYYPGADPAVAPDLIVGYADTYRASWATAEGGMPRELLEDNLDRWCGDHCIAHDVVPGILVTNRAVVIDDPALTDLAPTILQMYGIPTPPEMTGRPLFSPAPPDAD